MGADAVSKTKTETMWRVILKGTPVTGHTWLDGSLRLEPEAQEEDIAGRKVRRVLSTSRLYVGWDVAARNEHEAKGLFKDMMGIVSAADQDQDGKPLWSITKLSGSEAPLPTMQEARAA